MHGYWAARGLAQRGHRVFVVTNANEVEAAHRLHLSPEELAEGGAYARAFPDTGGFVKVFSTEEPDRKRMSYIPLNNPTVTRLATIATNVIRSEECRVIFSYYLEPFGVAAHLASSWTGIPYTFKHAGSDLYRLAPIEDLQTAYLEVMRGANRIISSGGCREQVLAYGMPEERIVSDVSYGLPAEYFNPDAEPFNLSALLGKLASADGQLPADFTPLNPSLPVLGVYGKLGEFKGSYDLLHAMSRLVRDGFPFYLVAMSGGWQKDYFQHLAGELNISEYVRFLPFQPHWKVPAFIRSCTALVFLERDFPIAAHGPTIPTEAISCGRCLIVSEEAARKQPFRMGLRNFKNIIVVPDPKEHDVLAQSIRFALENPRRAEQIGRRGFDELSLHQDTHQKYLDWLEALLTEVAAESPVRRDEPFAPTPQAITETKDFDASTSRLFALTHALLSVEQRQAVREMVDADFRVADASDEAQLTLQLGQKLLSFLAHDAGTKVSPVHDVCRYECELHEWRTNRLPLEKANREGIVFSPERVVNLFPSIRGRYKVVTFAHDVESIVEAVRNEQTPPTTASEIKILFHQDNAPMVISGPTERLLQLLEPGTRTTEEVFKSICDVYSCHETAAQTRLREACFSALEGLYWAGLIELWSVPSSAESVATVEETVG